MPMKKCLYLSNFGLPDSPPGRAAEILFAMLVQPAIEHYPEFDVVHYRYDSEPGSISEALLDQIRDADLVIADLTDLTPNGFYQLGVRHAGRLPTILLAQDDRVIPFDHRDFRYIVYHLDSRDPEQMQRTEDTLTEAIAEVLHTNPGVGRDITSTTPRETRHELAARIQEAAEAIRDLRINSAGDVVASLNKIAKELEAVEDVKTPTAMREAGEKFLKVLARIADQLATVKGSRIIIAGIISLVLGGAGFPAVTLYGLTLAFWQGPEMFAKAIDVLTKRKK
jgi:hypothetical protein